MSFFKQALGTIVAVSFLMTGCGGGGSSPAGAGGATAPTITSFSPTSGPVGTTVTITGTDFDPATANNAVTFNGAAAAVSAASATSLTVAVPNNASSGTIFVTTAAGTGSSATGFTVTAAVAAPTITGFTPSSGAAGDSVTITGTGFDTTAASNTVKFNGTTATVSSASATSLTVTVPSGATTGTISVTTGGGTATSSSAFTVTTSLGSLTLSGGASSTAPVVGGALPGSYTPATSSTSNIGLAWEDGSTNKVTVAGNMVLLNHSGGMWSTGILVGGLPSAGVTLDMAAGTVAFSNVSLAPTLSASGTVTLNGTLNLTAPLSGSALVFTGTGTAEAGDGLDAPAANVSLSAAIDSYSWISAQGVSVIVSDVHTNGLKGVQITTPAGPVFFTGNAGAGVTIDSVGKTVTFNNLTVSGQSPTTNALTINGSLTLP